MSETLQPVIVHPRLQDVRHRTFSAFAPHPWVLCEVRTEPPLSQPARDRSRMPARQAAWETGGSRWGVMRIDPLQSGEWRVETRKVSGVGRRARAWRLPTSR